MIQPEKLRARARELRIAASDTTFVDLHEERLELAGLLEHSADEIVRLRRPRRVISIGQENPND
jgi:hypothetical protein